MAKKSAEPSQIEAPANAEIQVPAPKRSHHKKPQPEKLSYEELQQKMCRSFNFAAFLLKSPKTYTEDDFIEEAKDLSRLAGKYSIINTALTLLDPAFFLFGIFGKVKEMLKDRPEKPAKETGQPADPNSPMHIVKGM